MSLEALNVLLLGRGVLTFVPQSSSVASGSPTVRRPKSRDLKPANPSHWCHLSCDIPLFAIHTRSKAAERMEPWGHGIKVRLLQGLSNVPSVKQCNRWTFVTACPHDFRLIWRHLPRNIQTYVQIHQMNVRSSSPAVVVSRQEGGETHNQVPEGTNSPELWLLFKSSICSERQCWKAKARSSCCFVRVWPGECCSLGCRWRTLNTTLQLFLYTIHNLSPHDFALTPTGYSPTYLTSLLSTFSRDHLIIH